jgi:aminoglycoside phosphotransferase family enzyme
MPVTVTDNQRRCEQVQRLVGFLSDAASYPESPASVELRETHMNWVFLTDRFVYKLKKPVRYEFLDFSTREKRRVDCEREVMLNRRLAPRVYHGTVPLTEDDAGDLSVGGAGEPVDWLVKMRRLPASQFLDQRIEQGTVDGDEAREVGRRLAAFYQRAESTDLTGDAHRQLLADSIRAAWQVLGEPRYGCDADALRRVVDRLMRTLREEADLFAERAACGRIVEAHGDLRPEHICLDPDGPTIIDCLEFNRLLRWLDPASELSFLELETRRAGASEIGRSIRETCLGELADAVDPALFRFYRGYHALVRAKLAVWHIDDPQLNDRPKWTYKANAYLHSVADPAD